VVKSPVQPAEYCGFGLARAGWYLQQRVHICGFRQLGLIGVRRVSRCPDKEIFVGHLNVSLPDWWYTCIGSSHQLAQALDVKYQFINIAISSPGNCEPSSG
jgi:hypothetical protein